MELDLASFDVLLVTGSQTWTYLPAIATVLTLYTHHAFGRGKRLLVVHGDCDRGADALAKLWVARRSRQGWPVDQQPYPADWTGPCRARCQPPDHRQVRRRDGIVFCPAAGTYRNEVMVALRPGWCEGFNRQHSPGTSGCLRLARRAQIPTEETTWEQRDRLRTRLAQPPGAH